MFIVDNISKENIVIEVKMSCQLGAFPSFEQEESEYHMIPNLQDQIISK